MGYYKEDICRKSKRIILIFSQFLYKSIIGLLPMKQGINKIKRNERIIISLTSYPKRFSYLPSCIKSLLYQTVKPDKIILWLGSDTQVDKIPIEIEKLKNYGVEICWKNENIKSHKKYYYVMQKYPNDIVITVDDDVIYSPFLISSLMKSHLQYPHAICARRVHKINIQERKILAYKYWDTSYEKEFRPSQFLIGIGVGGILYPPHSLYKDVFNKRKFMELCFNADDIWLKFMEVLNEKSVVWCKCLWIHPIKINRNDKTGLEQTNIGKNQNDLFIANMLKAYPQFIDYLSKEELYE